MRSDFTVASAEEMVELGKQLGKTLPQGQIIALFGDLGAGKTTLIKGLAEAIAGVSSREVCSPTFIYLNIYSGTRQLYHFDLYRLRGEDDFRAMGFEEYLNTNEICCIEWPERIESLLPSGTLVIDISYTGETSRNISMRQL